MYSKDQLIGILLSLAKTEIHVSKDDTTRIGYRVRLKVSFRGHAEMLQAIQRTLLQHNIESKYKEIVKFDSNNPSVHVADSILELGSADGYGTRFNIIYFGSSFENEFGGASITEGRMDLGMGNQGYPEGSGGPFNFLSLQTRNRKYATDTNVITMKNNGTVEAYQDMSYYFKIGNSSSRSGALGGSGLWVSSVGAFNALYSRCGTAADNGGNNWMNKNDPFPFKIVMGTNETAFTISAAGNVGINKEPSNYPLDVGGSIGARFVDIYGRNTSGANKNDDKYCMMYITGNTDHTKSDFVIDTSQTDNGLSIRTGIGTTVMRVDKDGRVGIGTDKPGQQFARENGAQKALLHVNGGYLFLSNEDNDTGTQTNRGGGICFESGDNPVDQGEHALIAVHAYDKDSTGTGNKDRNEMLFYIGNNDDGGYGPDMFTFVSSRFNVFAGSSPVSIEHPGKEKYGIEAARVISGRAWGNPTTNTDQVPQFTVDSFGISVRGEGRFTSNVTAYYSDERLKDFKGKITIIDSNTTSFIMSMVLSVQIVMLKNLDNNVFKKDNTTFALDEPSMRKHGHARLKSSLRRRDCMSRRPR